jgi:hypothetical protein
LHEKRSHKKLLYPDLSGSDLYGHIGKLQPEINKETMFVPQKKEVTIWNAPIIV